MSLAVRPGGVRKLEPVTKRAVIYKRGGRVVECEVTPALAEVIRLMDVAGAKAEARHRRREVTATDLGVDLSWFPDKRRFPLLLGESSVWAGPRRTTVVRGGRRVCRGCGQYGRMPGHAYCLYCDRAGRG